MRDVKRLRLSHFDDLIKEAMEEDGKLSRTAARKRVVEMLVKTAEDIVKAAMNAEPEVAEDFVRKTGKYAATKLREAESGGTWIPDRSEITTLNESRVHLLEFAHKISTNVSRFFCCRQAVTH